MKKQFSKIAFAAIGVALTITACKNSPHPGYDMVEEGLYAKFHTRDEKGIKPKEGDIVQVILVVKNDKDSILTDSKDPKFNRPGTNYYEFPLMKPEFKGSFEQGLTIMSVGDSASFLVNVDSMYKGKDLPPFLKKNSLLTYEAKLIKIKSKEEADKEQQKMAEEQKVMAELRKNEEPKALAKYLEDNKITTKPTANGLYYIETVKGKGAKAAKGDKVKVNYTGRLLDGSVFDTSDKATAQAAGTFDERRPYEPIELTLGEGRVIAGWEQGLLLMNEGSKGKLIIPSSLGYGEQSGGPIPPYSTLVFDVELVKISK